MQKGTFSLFRPVLRVIPGLEEGGIYQIEPFHAGEDLTHTRFSGSASARASSFRAWNARVLGPVFLPPARQGIIISRIEDCHTKCWAMRPLEPHESEHGSGNTWLLKCIFYDWCASDNFNGPHCTVLCFFPGGPFLIGQLVFISKLHLKRPGRDFVLPLSLPF